MDLALGDRCVSVGHQTPVTNPALRALGRAGVRYLSTRSIGTNHIDVAYAERVGIRVEGVTYSADSVADYTLMLILMAVRHAKEVFCRADGQDYRLHEVRGRELRDLTVGVVGVGRIGTAVVGRLRGFGCRVLTHDDRPQEATSDVPLDELLQRSDIVTLHTPLTADTHHLLDRRRIDRMRARRRRRQHRAWGAPRHRGPRVGAGERRPRRCGARRPRGGGGGLLRRPPHRPGRPRAAAAAPGDAERADQPAHGLLHRPCRERPGRELPRRLPEVRERSTSHVSGEDRHRVRRHLRGTPHLRQVGAARSPRASTRRSTSRSGSGSPASGAWRLCDGPEPDWESGCCRPAVLSPDRSARGLLVLDRGGYETSRPRPRVPRPARQVRRGRRDPGPAGALRPSLRGLRRPELGAVHRQVAGLPRRP